MSAAQLLACDAEVADGLLAPASAKHPHAAAATRADRLRSATMLLKRLQSGTEQPSVTRCTQADRILSGMCRHQHAAAGMQKPTRHFPNTVCRRTAVRATAATS